MIIFEIFDKIEKLINERGSNAILRDHLALLKEQISVLEQKIAALTHENTVLKSENAVLKVKLEESQIENVELRRKIKEYEQVAKSLPKGPRTRRDNFM